MTQMTPITAAPAQTLTGEIAVVTGGSRNIGKLTALDLAARGADVILTYRTEAGKAAKVVAEIEAMGRRAAALPLDLAESAQIKPFADTVRHTLSAWGAERFDILVNNAGIMRIGALPQVSEADLDANFAVNYKGVFLLTQALDPMLADGGRIVNLSSRLAEQVFPPLISYGPIKAAVQALVPYLAAHFAQRGIRVNAVAPGGLDDDFNATLFDEVVPGARDYIAGNTTLGRVGLPEDVAGVIAFLVEPASRFVTGKTIHIDGGFKL